MGNIHNYASNIKYDNTKTDFISETVQDMLDEIASHNHSTTEQMSQDINKLSEEKVDKKDVPTKTSQLTNDSGFLIEKPKYTASEVGADASGTAQTKVSEHNVSEESHGDIRRLVAELTTRLNTLANSDDTTLDQMAEVVAYIKNNKSLIDGITTNKVNVSDIIDNLTTSVSNKPLSAKQGVQLKALIDAIVVPTKTSQLQNDSNFVPKSVTDRLTEEIGDHSKNTIVHVTNTEKETWNNKSNFSGSYNDLSDKPTIPTVPTSLKNPYKLTISLGDSSYTYDGSKAVSITIEDGSEVIY